MKLKKIASLMLAGIMAVSMLAACEGSNTVKDPDSSSSQVVAPSNIATYANGAMDGAAKAVCTFESNSSLASALKTVAQNKDKVTPTILDAADGWTTWGAGYAAQQANMTKVFESVRDELNISGNIYVGAVLNDWGADKPVTNTNVDYYVDVCVLSSGLSEKAVGEAVATQFESAIKAFDTKIDNKVTTYKAYVEAVKVYNTLDEDADAWVVAVMFEKSLANNANVIA